MKIVLIDESQNGTQQRRQWLRVHQVQQIRTTQPCTKRPAWSIPSGTDIALFYISPASQIKTEEFVWVIRQLLAHARNARIGVGIAIPATTAPSHVPTHTFGRFNTTKFCVQYYTTHAQWDTVIGRLAP